MKKLACALLSLACVTTVQSAWGEEHVHGDSCHSCGMILSQWPGPKGFIEGASGQTYRFCSVKCMLCTLSRTGRTPAMSRVRVHEMTDNDWERPRDILVDADKAWYVQGSSRKATMGKSVAPFATREAAEKFRQAYGGTIYRIDELSSQILGCKVPKKPAEPIR